MSTGSATEITLHWAAADAETTRSAIPPAGDLFDGRFVTRGLIGRGGMGSVLRVERPTTGGRWRSKYCHLAGAEQKRFEREVRIMERVRHPHVVPIVFANLEHSPPYFVMPLAEGSLLGELDRFKDDEPLALEVFGQICAGIQALHASGIIHRDIKPANVLRFAGGRIAVSDFGLAKLDTRDSTILTQTGAFYGTFAYSAPEQHLPAGTREADVRTDVCQLGKMLYHMLTGKSPVLIEQDALPRGLAHIVQRATSAHPEDRYQTLGELLDALRYYALAKDPARNLREALENRVLQAEDLLRRHEYKAENLRAILGLLLQLDRHGPRTIIELFDRLPRALLPVLASEFAGEFLPPLRAYAGAIRSRVAGFPFALCRCRRAADAERVRPHPQPGGQDPGARDHAHRRRGAEPVRRHERLQRSADDGQGRRGGAGDRRDAPGPRPHLSESRRAGAASKAARGHSGGAGRVAGGEG